MRALRFGLIPRGEAYGARERDMVSTLSTALGSDVEVHRAADYRVVLAGLEQGLVDLAWLPPLVCARAFRSRLAEPVAVVVRRGDTSYSSALVAREDSPVRELSHLRGLRVAWVDRESASGYAVIRAALVRKGIALTSAFADEVFVRSHDAVVRAVLDGAVDVGATCAYTAGNGRFTLSPLGSIPPPSLASLRPIFEAGPIPSDVFAVRRDVPDRVRWVVEQALLHGVPDEARAAALALSEAERFAAPTPEHRRQLEALLDA
jgi:phosphate/phosphite/phosphonate ABC transporter binding protein